MTKINEVLRLKFDCQLSNRNIATCVKIGCSTVSEILSRFKLSELGWPLPDDISDLQLTQALYQDKGPSQHKVMPNFALYFKELKRKGMTKRLLWEEYHTQYQACAYGYTQFWKQRGWKQRGRSPLG